MIAQLKPQTARAEPAWTPPAQGKWTDADFVKLPEDGWRYEILRGELFMAPPPGERHQFTSSNLLVALMNFVKPRKLGRVYTAPLGVRLPRAGAIVQPDVVFVAAARAAEVIAEEGLRGAPDLIVEILSPSNWLTDRRDKFQLYQENGVREYWIVEPQLCVAEVFVLRGNQFTLLGRWSAGEIARSEILAGFEIALNEICGGE